MTMHEYYRRRAPEYDKIYETPEWQDELATLRAWLVQRTTGHNVLEIAAGTGYWTQVAAPGARSVTATDYSPELLARARMRKLGARVTLLAADAYALPESPVAFDVGMAHLWWSHVERQRRQQFLVQFASRLARGATILMIDQAYLKGHSAPAFRRDASGNRYELRTLQDGDVYQIIKNYPTARELQQSFAHICDDIRITCLGHFWSLQARLREA
jgi:SAM-dependent methyltransferase